MISDLFVTGVNFNSGPLGVRERLAIANSDLPRALNLLCSLGLNGVILSTCNRTEVYFASSNAVAGAEFFEAYFGDTSVFAPYLYTLSGKRAAEHLLEVAAGLDSMVLGEFEILGQVSRALRTAEDAGAVGEPVKHLFLSAIRTGREVRLETNISEGALSVSAMAVECAAKIIPDFSERRMLVVGAGEAGQLTAKVAHKRGVSRITLLSRNPLAARDVANEIGANCCGLDKLEDELSTASIVITCSMAPHWILTGAQVSCLMKERPSEPLVLIDIAVPRNIEPAAGRVANVFLYNLDDLLQLAELNRANRQAEVSRARYIIATELCRFEKWWQAFEVRPAIKALTSKAEAYRRLELEKCLSQMTSLSFEDRSRLDMMTRSIVKKLLIEPIKQVKDRPDEYRDTLVGLFQLNL